MWLHSNAHLIYLFFESIIEFVRFTCEFNKFNGEFVHILNGDGQKMCRKIKSTIYLFFFCFVFFFLRVFPVFPKKRNMSLRGLLFWLLIV
jgi:hypothetical protein